MMNRTNTGRDSVKGSDFRLIEVTVKVHSFDLARRFLGRRVVLTLGARGELAKSFVVEAVVSAEVYVRGRRKSRRQGEAPPRIRALG